MIKILFVCHGNICRSTMAEFIMKDIVNKQGLSDIFHIESSATHTDEIWNGVGSPVYPPARAKLAEHGIGTKDNELGVSAKRARLTSRTDYDKFDFIIGMDCANIRNLNSLFRGDPEGKVRKMLEFAGREGDVADPWYTGNFDATWNDCSEGCHGLLRQIMVDPRFRDELSYNQDVSYDFDDDMTYKNDFQRYDDFPRG
ncbi:low molecular weight protein-tyrosine-phosphatase [Butyrivibrio sp. YAB3001]|uniref:low molecular weight protein-tyrosine-phosphatase n=1 Tax=Butyrivibrio sp. YAB3001 TaxID=1520812 RepID=UPI0008F6896A|nr:low molecular weight protein-tyrosine-phosphatase [Butyrivibrio sp. YAB3001]SFC34739.1 protein-tyrosine phosphatase [Butyrivibrio sp. YAB3001]